MEERHLKQAKKRNDKIKITEAAIEKVPYIRYKGLSEKQNKVMRQLTKDVLKLAKDMNNSNEAAITCDLNADCPLEGYGIAFGTEHNVDVCSDTESYHLLLFAQNVMVAMLHNHPSTQTFSIQDLLFFYHYSNVKIMVVVSNQGKVHYLVKETSYDSKKFFELFQHFNATIENKQSFRSVYAATQKLLKDCGKAGILYG